MLDCDYLTQTLLFNDVYQDGKAVHVEVFPCDTCLAHGTSSFYEAQGLCFNDTEAATVVCLPPPVSYRARSSNLYELILSWL